MIRNHLFSKTSRTKPSDLIPSVKTNLQNIDLKSDVLIWFGHSSYYIQTDGLRILVDPVFSGNASPLPGTVKAFKGANTYSVDDLPEIDYLFITHDHYDHLDYKTIAALKARVKQVICGLGVGAHFESWGYDPDRIIEKDWYDNLEINSNFNVFVEPARHFSGRGLLRNKTLWVSYVLETPVLKIFMGGDSGYDSHYATIGNKYGPFDLAILENGQYNEAWPYIHHSPDQVLKAAVDLKAKRILPVHSSKFALSRHPWDEPLIRLSALNKAYEFPVITPLIGEVVYLSDSTQEFGPWWEGLD